MTSFAQTYKCTNRDGSVGFSDKPCLGALAAATKTSSNAEAKISRLYDQPTQTFASAMQNKERKEFAQREFEALAREAYRRHQLLDASQYKRMLCVPSKAGDIQPFAGVQIKGVHDLSQDGVAFVAEEDPPYPLPNRAAFIGVKFAWRSDGPCVSGIDRWRIINR